MSTGQYDIAIIASMLQEYFDGIYEADTARLRNIFHEDASLKAPGLRRSRDEWLQLVGERPVPKEEGHPYCFRILSIEVIGEQAMAKVECPIFEQYYIDYLGFLKEGGIWKIVNKMYTAV